ncbi:MAG TPA: DUF5063 domain-containing protein [Gaiellaceae bacterium]|nr:DUF5063 domain-containing protein [Gaiellaceae bacterium]
MQLTSSDSSAENFASLSMAFCELVESSESVGLGELVDRATKLIVGLYDAAMRLPQPQASEHDAPQPVTKEEWWTLFRRLSLQLGEINNYSFVFDPYEQDAAPVTGSLADDLAGIYSDLRVGLALYAAEAYDDAIWEWRFGFESHWGRHAAHALYALHVAKHSGTVVWIEHGRPTSFGPTSLG